MALPRRAGNASPRDFPERRRLRPTLAVPRIERVAAPASRADLAGLRLLPAFEADQGVLPCHMLTLAPQPRCRVPMDNVTSRCERAELRPLVVVVDNDAAVCNSLKFSLEIEGFAVRTYASVEELLSDADRQPSNCLVVDLNLPGMNGLEAIALLRARQVSAPAILITSHPSQRIRERAAIAAVPIVEKPFLGNALLDQIRSACDRCPRA
jgi:CheY-like chemotaxis protein